MSSQQTLHAALGRFTPTWTRSPGARRATVASYGWVKGVSSVLTTPFLTHSPGAGPVEIQTISS